MENKSIIVIGQVVNHHTLYQNLLLFLQQHFLTITFLSREEIIEQIEPKILENINIVVDNSLIHDVFKKNIGLINTHDVLISDEYHSAYFYLRNIKFLNKKRIIILHNINRWIKVNPNVLKRRFIDWFYRKRIFSQFDTIITVAPNIADYYKQTKPTKNVFFFPFDEFTNEIAEEHKKEGNINEICIVVPGVVLGTRRNYVTLLNVIERYYAEHKNSRIQFKFLGKIEKDKEPKIFDLIQRINKKYNNKIDYWTHFVPLKEFEKEIVNSAFILSNIVLQTKMKGIKEYYGITKESGISFIAYKYAKPTIVPLQQKILKGFESQLITFNNYNEILTILPKIENSEININALKQNALKNRLEFNKLITKEKQNLLRYLIK